MRRFGLALCLVFAFAAAVVAGSSVTASAQVVGTPILITYSFLGVGSTMTAACNNALAEMNESCLAHGSVTYDRGRCITTYPPFLDPVTICDCKAQTHLCLRPLPWQ